MSSDKKTNVRSLTLRGIQLIDTVHKWRPLWDRTTPLHKNMKVLKYCWNQVAIELGSEDQLVKKKWKLLRDYFFRSLRECKANDKPDSWDKFITWPYYDKLQFLTIYQDIEIDHTKYKMNDEELKIIQEAAVFEKKQRTLAKLNSSLSKYDAVLDTDSPLPSPVIVLDDSEQESVDNTDNYQPPPFKILKPATSSLQKDVMKPIATLTEPPPLRLIDKKKLNSVTSPKLQQNYPSSSKTSTPPPNIIGSNFTDSESDAADLHFFQSLLPFMRQFPLRDKIRVRNGIHDLILNELNAINPAGDATRPEPLNEYIKYESEELQTFPTTSYDGSEKTDDDQLYSVIIKEEYENDKKLFTIDSSNITFEGDDENEMF